MTKTLGTLVAAIAGGALAGDPSLLVSQVTTDSRMAAPDVVFVAVRGTTTDGHRFVDQALAGGAAAVVVEDTFDGDLAPDVTVFRCPDTRAVPALMARALHGQPDRELWTAAVTGTNGKTTTSFLLQEMLRRLHGPCGLLGTILYDDGQQNVPAPLTTPGGPVFYETLGRMVSNGCRSVALELSSHALVQERTAGLGLDVAVMTNLGRDHLDYHGDMAGYLAAKAGIMAYLREGTTGVGTGLRGALVINVGDPHLAGLDTGDCRVIRFGARPGADSGADLYVTTAELSLTGTRLRLSWQGKDFVLNSPLVGRFNVENLTAAMAAGIGLGLAPEACAAALAGVAQVPGRLERFPLPNGAIAVVDYAHTHDALAAVLAACDELGDGRLLLVFGCGGDRDRGKRPLMAAVAAMGSDLVWITSDNPRTEDPAEICAEIADGYDAVVAPRARERLIVVDRTEAVNGAMSAAGPGDIVIVAGKGHEDYQLVGDRILALDDRLLVADWIARQGSTGTGAT